VEVYLKKAKVVEQERVIVMRNLVMNNKMLKKMQNGSRNIKNKKLLNLIMFYRDSKKYKINWYRRQKNLKGKHNLKTLKVSQVFLEQIYIIWRIRI
jgi:hypothetical protein